MVFFIHNLPTEEQTNANNQLLYTGHSCPHYESYSLKNQCINNLLLRSCVGEIAPQIMCQESHPVQSGVKQSCRCTSPQNTLHITQNKSHLKSSELAFPPAV